MSTWQVANRLTGEGVYAYGADAPDHLNLYPFDAYNHNRVPETAPIIARRVSKLQFRNLFSTAEKIAIEFEAIDNPSAAQEARLQAA